MDIFETKYLKSEQRQNASRQNSLQKWINTHKIACNENSVSILTGCSCLSCAYKHNYLIMDKEYKTVRRHTFVFNHCCAPV